MSMLLNRHMELLNIVELAPEPYTVFMRRNVAQKTKNNVPKLCKYKKKTNVYPDMHCFLFKVLNVYLCCAAK